MRNFVWTRLLFAPYGIAVGLCILVMGVLMASAGPLLPVVIANEIGLDKVGVATFFLTNTLVGIVIALGTGYLSDGMIARYKLVLIGGVFSAVGYFGIASAAQPLQVFFAGPCIGGIGILFTQLFAVAKDGVVAEWEPEQQVIGITMLRTLFSFGYILGTAVSSLLARAADIQSTFYLIAGAAVVLAVFGTLLMYRIERYIKARQARVVASDRPAAAREITLPFVALIVPLLSLIVLQGADSTRLSYLSLVMFQMFRDASIAPMMFGIGAAVELVTMSLMGYLSSKIRENVVIAIGALCGVVQFLILAFADSLPVLYLGAVIHAVFVAALFGVAMAYIQRLLAHRTGFGGALYVTVLNLGSLVGILSPLLVTGYDQKIFVIPAILCALGAVLLLVGDK
ncbi:MAG: MFS transporter, partial [Anaerolineae bacterium]